MLIMILDDERYRHSLIRSWLSEQAEVVDAFSADDAIAQLEARGAEFDVVFLDHDLGTRKTGAHVAEHIASLPSDRRPKLVVVHSVNVAGAIKMIAILAAAGVPVQRRVALLQ